MIRTFLLGCAVVAGAAMWCTSASAQSLSAGGEATNDEVRRGLSWSDGDWSLSADALATSGPIEASARVAMVRGSERHGGADAVADLALGTAWDVGAIRARADATVHLFAGAAGQMDYAEIGASASYGYGPVRLTGGAVFAPSQRAIGGSNLYLFADADAGIPGTPLTVLAGIGHSSGDVDDAVRAQRLRPGGSYADWRLGLEHRWPRWTLAVTYAGTDVERADAFGPFADARHADDRIIGRVRASF